MNGAARKVRDGLQRGAVDLHELGGSCGMTRDAMARWAERPTNASMLDRLEALARRRTALIVASARAEAAKALLALAVDVEGAAETARKACVDLLKLDPSVGAAPASAHAHPPAHRNAGDASSEAPDAIRAALERLGQAEARIAEGVQGGSEPTDDGGVDGS